MTLRLGGMKFKPEISWKWRLGFVRFDASLGQLSFMKVTSAGVFDLGEVQDKVGECVLFGWE